MDVKQTIIIRTKYPDGKGGKIGIRRGKEIAQTAHASGAFMAKLLTNCLWEKTVPEVSEEVKQWLMGTFTKVVLQTEDEQTLKDIDKAAREAGIISNLITDNGYTEFHGIPTITALAIGPAEANKIDEITGPQGKFPLKLY